MSFLDLAGVPIRELYPGCKARVVHSKHMSFVHWYFDANSVIGEHSHPHEQVATVIEGELDLTIAGETRRVGSGSVAIIPPNALHSARCPTTCYVIDAFYPVREDYR